MDDVTVQLDFLIQRLPSEGCAAEALFFSEINSFATSAGDATSSLHALVPAVLKESLPSDISQRQSPGELAVESLSVTITAPKEGVYWRDPVPLTFHAVRWVRPEGLHLAYVPQLQVSAVAPEEHELLPQLEKEIRFALQRHGAASSLPQLLEFQRVECLEVHRSELKLPIKSPKQRTQEATADPADKSVLKDVGVDLTQMPLPRAVAIAKSEHVPLYW